jgi:hypothetical protein
MIGPCSASSLSTLKPAGQIGCAKMLSTHGGCCARPLGQGSFFQFSFGQKPHVIVRLFCVSCGCLPLNVPRIWQQIVGFSKHAGFLAG